METIETLFPAIDEGSMLPSVAIGLALFILITVTNAVAIRRKVTAIWRKKE